MRVLCGIYRSHGWPMTMTMFDNNDESIRPYRLNSESALGRVQHTTNIHMTWPMPMMMHIVHGDAHILHPLETGLNALSAMAIERVQHQIMLCDMTQANAGRIRRTPCASQLNRRQWKLFVGYMEHMSRFCNISAAGGGSGDFGGRHAMTCT